MVSVVNAQVLPKDYGGSADLIPVDKACQLFNLRPGANDPTTCQPHEECPLIDPTRTRKESDHGVVEVRAEGVAVKA